MFIVYIVFAALMANVAIWAVWTVGAAESRETAAFSAPLAVDHHPQRYLKGDRLAQQGTEPLAEVASIEVWGPSHEIVLRGSEGEVVLWVDSANTTTVVTKGVSIPQLTMQDREAAPAKPRWLSLVLASLGQ
mgnify:CR=1 FL=1